MEKQKLVKETKIEYVENYGGGKYGGVRAWTMQRYINGKELEPNSHLVLKREYFNNLQEAIMQEIENGFTVTIKKH